MAAHCTDADQPPRDRFGSISTNGAVSTMSGLRPLATELRTSMVVWFVP